jgi:hypothetical protein
MSTPETKDPVVDSPVVNTSPDNNTSDPNIHGYIDKPASEDDQLYVPTSISIAEVLYELNEALKNTIKDGYEAYYTGMHDYVKKRYVDNEDTYDMSYGSFPRIIANTMNKIKYETYKTKSNDENMVNFFANVEHKLNVEDTYLFDTPFKEQYDEYVDAGITDSKPKPELSTAFKNFFRACFGKVDLENERYPMDKDEYDREITMKPFYEKQTTDRINALTQALEKKQPEAKGGAGTEPASTAPTSAAPVSEPTPTAESPAPTSASAPASSPTAASTATDSTDASASASKEPSVEDIEREIEKEKKDIAEKNKILNEYKPPTALYSAVRAHLLGKVKDQWEAIKSKRETTLWSSTPEGKKKMALGALGVGAAVGVLAFFSAQNSGKIGGKSRRIKSSIISNKQITRSKILKRISIKSRKKRRNIKRRSKKRKLQKII